MSDVVYGKDVVLMVSNGIEYIAVGCAFSCGFSFTNELINKTDVNAGYAIKRRVRMSDCSATISGLTTLENTAGVVSVMWFLQESIRRTVLSLQILMTDEAGLMKTITGDFVIESVDLSGDVSGFGEFTINLQGTGGIGIAAVDPPSGSIEPVCEVEDTLYLTLVEGEYIIHDSRLQGDYTILWITREGMGYDETTGVAGNRQFVYHKIAGNIEFNPFVRGAHGGEAVAVGYKSNS